MLTSIFSHLAESSHIVDDAIDLYNCILHSLPAQVVMVNLVNAARKVTCGEGMRLCFSCVSKVLTLSV